MIDSVSSTSLFSTMQMKPPMEDVELTDEEKTQLQEIISKYDPENMTEDDKKTMMDEIRAAGIGPGEDMKTIMEEAGFDMKPPEPPKGMAPPEDMEGLDVDSVQSDLTLQLLEKLQSGDTSEDDMLSFLQLLQSQGEATTGLLVNQNS